MATIDAPVRDLSYWQGARYRPGSSRGHYESWFLRANHPTRRLAFWIRYTIFVPQHRPQDAIGERWAILFDGERRMIRAAKAEVPISECEFARRGLDVRIDGSVLKAGELRGSADGGAHRIQWSLVYRDGAAPMVFMPERTYEARWPAAKSLCTRPQVVFDGTLDVDGESIAVDGWIGSENHNWGSRHTDTYAWGQVVGFDNAPEAFLECATARLKLGPLWTPPMTVVCLRFDGRDYRLNARLQMMRAKGSWKDCDWDFDSACAGARIHGRFHAAPEDFVSLTYYNPPGGDHTCLNSKLAACEVTLERPREPPVTLTTRYRAAFEILT